jgi:hypothetical protein
MEHSPTEPRAVTQPRCGSSATAKIAGLLTLLGCLVALLYAAPAHAQASRTWVSGVGNDANPCSRTAPCKTFAGAISKTAAKGEINCLDPGGFGAVTITKAITINCEGVIAGVLAAGTNGVVVNAGPTDRVILRGLDINGFGTGINGIRFLAGQALLVENCIIYEFTTNGIDMVIATNSSLTVKNTIITDVSGAGIRFGGGGGVPAISADRVTIFRVGTNAVQVGAPGTATVSNSQIFGNGAGVAATAGGAIMNASNNLLENNNIGANASVAGATVALTNNDLFANNTAVNAVVGSNFISGNNNRFSGNASDGAAPSAFMTVH